MAPLLAALTLASGLFGTVSRGPTTPVCRVGVPCSKPAVGVRLEFVRGGRVVRSVVTGARGAYRVLLPPGTYALRVEPRSPVGGVKPATVTVGSALRRVDVFVDTGIR